MAYNPPPPLTHSSHDLLLIKNDFDSSLNSSNEKSVKLFLQINCYFFYVSDKTVGVRVVKWQITLENSKDYLLESSQEEEGNNEGGKGHGISQFRDSFHVGQKFL